MNAYIDTITVTDANGNESILYPRTKKEAVFGLQEALEDLANSDITETTDTTMPNSYDGRLLVDEIGGVREQVTTAGNQLFDYTEMAYKSHISEEENGFIKFSNNTSANEYPTHTYNLPKGNYTVSLEIQSNSNSTIYVASSVSDYSKPITGVGKHTINFSEVELVWVCIAGKDGANMKLRIMINSGTTALPWEPYTGGQPAPSPTFSMEIKKSVVSKIKTHGKNIVKHNATNQTIYGVTFKPNADGSISVSGTATDVATYMIRNYDIKNLKYGTSYILSGCPNGGSATTFGLSINSGDYVQSAYDFGEGNTFSLNKSNMTNFALFIRVYKGATVNTTFYPMIREASVADGTYEPYKESSITLSKPIDLYGKGDVQDVIENGKVKSEYALCVLDGTKNISRSPQERDSTTYRFYISDANAQSKIKKPASNQVADILSNMLIPETSDRVYWSVEGISVASSGAFMLYHEKFKNYTVEQMKEFLTNTPISVVYRLATPTTEALPTADQVALNSLATFDGITYLEFDAELQPTFEGEYGTSKVGGYTLEGMLAGLNGELYGKSNEERITALETSVVNNI